MKYDILIGQAKERSIVIRKLRKVTKNPFNYTPGVVAFARDLIEWLKERRLKRKVL